jgi:prepilin-type N-terminal cleavage/methylation domain-containing protein
MRKADGFSLVEVLIAAAILAVALLAIASMFPIAHTNVDWSGDQTVAVTVAAPSGRNVQVLSLIAR